MQGNSDFIVILAKAWRAVMDKTKQTKQLQVLHFFPFFPPFMRIAMEIPYNIDTGAVLGWIFVFLHTVHYVLNKKVGFCGVYPSTKD